jgi:hypothetical protein
MISTVDLVWQKSLENEEEYPNHSPKVKKHHELESIAHNYTRAVDAIQQKESQMDRSSFRVMPVHLIEPRTSRSRLADSLSD